MVVIWVDGFETREERYRIVSLEWVLKLLDFSILKEAIIFLMFLIVPKME